MPKSAKYKSANCIYFEDGKILDNGPKLFTKNDEVIWEKKEYAHHDIKLAENKESFFILTGEAAEFDGEKVKSDCISKRDLNNRDLEKWCLADHLEELKQLGFEKKKEEIDKATSERLNLKFEISHANSISELPGNSQFEKSNAFEKGNILVNFYGSARMLLILDKQLKKILWHQNLSRFPLTKEIIFFEAEKKVGKYVDLIFHDAQLLKSGKILAFATRIGEKKETFAEDVLLNEKNRKEKFQTNADRRGETNQLHRGFVLLYDPINPEDDQKIIWHSPEPIFPGVPISGSVSQIDGNKYLISETTNNGTRALISNESGTEIWKFPLAAGQSGGIPRFYRIKEVEIADFLKNRGIEY